MSYKFLSFLALVIFCTSFVTALSIDSQSSFSEGTQWGFIASFDTLSNGETGEIIINNEKVMSVFRHNNSLYVDESILSSKIVSFKINNYSITLSLVGYPESEVTILLKRINADSVVNQVEKIVKFVELSSKSEQDALRIEVSSLQTKINNLEESISQKDQQISNLEIENSKLLGDIQTLQSTIRLLEQDGKTNEEILTQVKDDLDVLLIEREEARKSPLTGLFVFGAENSSFLFVALLLIVLVVVGVFIKTRKTSIYDSPIFDNEGDLDYSKSLENASKKQKGSFFQIFSNKKVESIDESSDSKKGKWASESYFPQKDIESKEEDKRFDLGDLIKK